MGDDEAYFIPFWILSGSTSRVEPERRQSEGRVEAERLLYYTKKAKNQGATFEKKKWHYVAFDNNNNNNNNRYETTVHTLFHTPFHELQCKHSDQQTHTTKC